MSLRLLGQWFVFLAVRVAVAVVQAVEIETCDAACHLLAYLCYDVARIRRRGTDENLAHAFPELSLVERQQIARRMWRHLLLFVCEVAHTPRKIHETNWRKHVRLERGAELVGLLTEAQPKVLVTAHFGNFEVAGFMSGILGYPSYTVARTLDNPFLDAYIKRFRQLTRQVILPKSGSAGMADEILTSNGLLTIAGDQHAGDKGLWVDFFGRPASCHKAMAIFSLTNQAPMAVFYFRRTTKPMHFALGLQDLFDPRADAATADVRSVTEWYNRQLEAMIRVAPDQYWWLHNRWREPPASVKRSRAKKAAESVAVSSEAPLRKSA